MSIIIVLAILFAVICYLAASGMILLRRTQNDAPALISPNYRPFYLGLAWLAAGLHSIVLAQIIPASDGIDLSIFSTAALVSLMIVLLFLLAAVNKPVDKLGIAVLPLAAMTLLLRLAYSDQVHILTHLSWPMEMHILVSILAFSLLNIAALQALLLALQDWQLRRKHTNWFVRSLPPLQTMESLLFQMIGVGFILLSLSLATGFVFLEDLFAQHLVHKTVLSILSWLLFAVLLWGRWRYGWRGRTAIRWTLGGFAALVLAYFGSKLVLEIILHRV